MPHVLLATDADWIRDDIDAALSDPDTTVSRVRRGSDVTGAIAQIGPDLVILDLQIGNMGGIATCHAIRHEEAAGRLDPVKVLLLLDRADDRWLATTSGADGWMVKPLDTFRVRRAARAILAGEPWDEHPEPVG
ncbi:response regulator [Actinomarinicola tropica]|uniref:response regulator n=1 Tax=Actinomarinicola tropica TaxID=2789776 RepID=UPI001898A83C|nr:response regulator [Actinomarinicola tropica]